jgi:hypothetical protein
VDLTDASVIAVNAALGDTFALTLEGDYELGNPTSPSDGQRMIVLVTQGSGAPYTLSYGSAYLFSTGLPQPTLSTTAWKTDALGFMYSEAPGGWLFMALVSGYS